MGERTEYAPGTFCWADLSTTDQDGAKAFYSELFGWKYDDNPVGDGAFYSMAQLDGKYVAAIATQPAQQREAGAPPMWNNYVSVESADDVVARARELGASVDADAFDVMEAGRMGVIQDPQGAYFLAWEPNRHFGAQLVNAPGALSWIELSTTDLDAASRFYGELLGWKMTPFEGMDTPYNVIMNGERSTGGMQPLTNPGSPPFWLTYFATDDLDRTVKSVGERGGRVLVDSLDIGMAKIAVVQDPQGALFALYDGRLDP